MAQSVGISWLWRLKSDATGSIPTGWVRGVTWVRVNVKAGLWTGLDSGLDSGLDHGLQYGLNSGLIFERCSCTSKSGLWPGSLAGSLLNINGDVLGAGFMLSVKAFMLPSSSRGLVVTKRIIR